MALNTQAGLAIINKLREQAGVHTNRLAAVGFLGAQYPVEYRNNTRAATIAALARSVGSAERDFYAWVNREAGDARRRYRDGQDGGTEAETRRLRREMELQRLIATGRASDEKSGGRVINDGRGGNTYVKNGSAWDFASKAESAFMGGDYESAQLFAQASQALDGPGAAATILQAAQEMLDSPAQAAARKDLAALGRAAITFEREAKTALAMAYAHAAEGARFVGADHRQLETEARRSAMQAKLAALGLADRTADGTVVPGTYKDPGLGDEFEAMLAGQRTEE
jgi:hypothetical protein